MAAREPAAKWRGWRMCGISQCRKGRHHELDNSEGSIRTHLGPMTLTRSSSTIAVVERDSHLALSRTNDLRVDYFLDLTTSASLAEPPSFSWMVPWVWMQL
jgi:hypothetical protein